MDLHIAVIILLNPGHDYYLNYAKELLQYFIRAFEKIYCPQHLSYYVHRLLHLFEDYNNFGQLDNCSAFQLENFMKVLKNKVRKHKNSLK